MNTRTLCLGILAFGEATGYEIRKLSIEGQFRYFADASFGSIYPALSRLEKDGLVVSREEVQQGKPARKVYAITEAGRDVFREALREVPSPDIYRSEFLFVALCADMVEPETIRLAVEARKEQLRAEIAHIEEIMSGCDEPSTQWVCRNGIACMSASLAFLEANHGELEAIAAHPAAPSETAPSETAPSEAAE